MTEQFPRMTLQQIYDELVRRSKERHTTDPSTYEAGHDDGLMEAYRAAADMLLNAYILPNAK